MEYPWYDDVNDSVLLEQGDIIEECFVLVPSAEHYQDIISGQNTGNNELPIQEINGIVMSQSCDIVQSKIDSIILCSIWSLEYLIKNKSHFKSSKATEELRQGKYPAYHLLNIFETDTMPRDFYFVDFHSIYSVPKTFLEATLSGKTRKRLLPPYREHLSQSFARYFMRVGLPIDIEKEKIKEKFDEHSSSFK
ncbi:MAG: hypothetical protein LBK06_00510 [Planctomycetaceae bacterium]|jgi:hypothetical protein|nr:hypothetical protein [Planctomycetaceae bacterium]